MSKEQIKGFIEPVITSDQYVQGDAPISRKKYHDRRKEHACLECKTLYKGKKGMRGVSKWCPQHENVELSCLVCNKNYLIRRKFYIFRGSKVCGMKCYGIWRSLNYSGDKSPKWKGGIDHVIAYRARKALCEGFHTNFEWEELKMKYQYMCLCCKKFEPEIKLEEDHIIPLSKGGTNYIINIQPLCRSCNARKSASATNFINLFLLENAN